MHLLAFLLNRPERILSISCPDANIRTEIYNWLIQKDWCANVKDIVKRKKLIVFLTDNCAADDLDAVQKKIIERWQKEIPFDLT